MAFSRESSPSLDSPSSPAQLTPNSKVKAMLAALDQDSDDEVNKVNSRTDLLSKFTNIASSEPSLSLQDRKSLDKTIPVISTAEVEDELKDDEDEEEVVRPKGRIAARMQVARESSDEEISSTEENARERVKKMLMAKSNSPEPTSNNEDSENNNERDVRKVSRKRKLVTRRGTPKSSPAKETASPSLFVTPAKSATNSEVNSQDSDSDALPDLGNDRFKALVEKKRQERLAREQEAASERARKLAEHKKHTRLLDEDENEFSDEETGRRLTQPTRKAGKKAQEEIRRETQRMSRNQQLAHQAKTKKKFPKANLFARFNFRQEVKVDLEPTRPTSSSSAAPASDIDMKDTPPTSPAPSDSHLAKTTEELTLLPIVVNEDNDERLPEIEVALAQMPSSPPVRLDKGKGKAIEEPLLEGHLSGKPLPRLRQPKVAGKESAVADDSDSDLEIVSAKTPKVKERLDAIFDRVPVKQARESQSLHALRMLAKLTSPDKKSTGKNKRPGMTKAELQLSLQQRARQQAQLAQEERKQKARARGHIPLTEEEREKEQNAIEDLVERARQEADDLKKREKAAARKEAKARGEEPLEDSSDDEDWEEEKENVDEGSASSSGEEDPELSGESEDDAEEDEMDIDGKDEAANNSVVNPFLDTTASDTDDDGSQSGEHSEILAEEAEDGDIDEDEEEQLPVKKKERRNRNTNIISDDDSEDGDEEKPTPQAPRMHSPTQSKDSPAAPNSVLRSATKTFIPGLTVEGPVGLGLTQIFAGTMDESQAFPSPAPTNESSQISTQNDSMAFLKRLPQPELPPFVPTMAEDSQTQDQDIIMDSQTQKPESQALVSESQRIHFQFSQSQIHGFDSLVDSTQMSPFPEATQDIGFQHMTPIRGRFVDAPPSTVDTLILDRTLMPETTEQTPIVKKKGKLRRRAPAVAYSDDEEDAQPVQNEVDEDFEITADAFDVMRKASKNKEAVDDFDKKNSKAKEMVDEQANESEDEYAGLGGASDDESGEEDEELMQELLDDEGKEIVDERKNAALFADRERADDSKNVEKIFKGVHGGFRKRRGADYELSDSDDGGEATRRIKRAKFAKMSKALLADEGVAKIAENPKKQAFMRSMEDQQSEDDMGDFEMQEEETDSQSQSLNEQMIPDSQPMPMGPPKRTASAEFTDTGNNRLLTNQRRTKKVFDPAEFSRSLSSLLEERNELVVPLPDDASDDELEIEGEPSQKENRAPFALRRGNVPIIDRISLKRASSSNLSTSSKLAFAASSAAAVGQFKVPALLRRATTNNSLASSTSSTERTAGEGGSETGIKRGGGKNSGVHYFTRETERRANVMKTEKRREQRRVRGAERRRKVVGGLFGGGKFE